MGNRVFPGQLLVALLAAQFLGCPDTFDDDDIFGNEPPEIDDYFCHLRGAFLRLTPAVGAYSSGSTSVDCDFNGDGNTTSHSVNEGAIQWLSYLTDGADSYVDNHNSGSVNNGLWLNGGEDGVNFVIYVGGVNVENNDVFLWISYHGTPTMMAHTSEPFGNELEMCNPLWSFNNPDKSVNSVLRDYCATASYSRYSGHVSNANHDNARFGWFPLGAFDIWHVDDSPNQYQLRQGSNVIELEGVDGGTSFLADLDCNSSMSQVSTALTDGGATGRFKLQHLTIEEATSHLLMGDEYHPGDENDTLKGLVWSSVVGTSNEWVYINRTSVLKDEGSYTTETSDFEDDIEDIQNQAPYNFTSDCLCNT